MRTRLYSEAEFAEAYAPVLLAEASTGDISDLTAVPALTTADAKTAFEAAQDIRKGF